MACLHAHKWDFSQTAACTSNPADHLADLAELARSLPDTNSLSSNDPVLPAKGGQKSWTPRADSCGVQTGWVAPEVSPPPGHFARSALPEKFQATVRAASPAETRPHRQRHLTSCSGYKLSFSPDTSVSPAGPSSSSSSSASSPVDSGFKSVPVSLSFSLGCLFLGRRSSCLRPPLKGILKKRRLDRFGRVLRQI
jgi:hypothetical protein